MRSFRTMVIVITLARLSVAATMQEISFNGAGGAKLSGTITLPAAAEEKFPAAVLVAGSGPTDRDGNQPTLKIDLLKQIADDLAEHGIATLRYDKRGQYASGKAPQDPAKLEEFVVWENYVDDVIAAMRALQIQPQIDPDRVALIGHSEGGLLVMLASAKTAKEANPPVALALLSTPGRPTDVVIREQIKSLLVKQKANAEQTKFFVDKNDAIIKSIRETGKVPTDVPAGLMALYPPYLGKFLQGQFQLSPAELAQSLTPPVLVIQGEKDVQVSAERDAKALEAALQKRPAVESKLVVIPDASHNLKPIKLATDAGFEGAVSPQALQTLRDWLKLKFNN